MDFGLDDIFMLIGALGVFLYGMKTMSEALLLLAGDRLRKILATMTSNRVFGIFTGFLITSIIQSSSATTLMVVSFSNAGLLTLVESIGVIMGANIGTTVTAWIIAILGFKVSMSTVALPLVGLGFGITFLKKKFYKNLGNFIVGFALLFIGLEFLKDAMPDINNNPQLLSVLSNYTDLGYLSIFIFLLIGTLLTVVVQSSSATMALTLIMTAEGWIPFHLAAAMILGENVGTTITANIAAVIGNFRAKQTARAHFVFNIIGVLWMLVLFYPFLRFIDWLSLRIGAGSPFVSAAAIPVAISLYHTIFNLANTFILVWFVNPIARLVEYLVPSSPVKKYAIDEPKFLTSSVLKYPETLISALRNESIYLFENPIFEIVAHSLSIRRTDIMSGEKAKAIIMKSNIQFMSDPGKLYLTKVKAIYGKIIEYGIKAQSDLPLTEIQHNEISQLKAANRKMVETIKIVEDLSKNVNLYMVSDNSYIKTEYDKLRRKVVKVLKLIYRIRTEDATEEYHAILRQIKQQAKKNKYLGAAKIDKLIRNDLITANMASSYFNDFDNVNDIVRNLIDVTDLLFAQKDPLFQNGKG